MIDATTPEVLQDALHAAGQPPGMHEAPEPAAKQHDVGHQGVLHSSTHVVEAANLEPRPLEHSTAVAGKRHGLTVDVQQEHEPAYSAGAPSDAAQDTTIALVPACRATNAAVEHAASEAGTLAVGRVDADFSSPSSGHDARSVHDVPASQAPQSSPSILQQQHQQHSWQPQQQSQPPQPEQQKHQSEDQQHQQPQGQLPLQQQHTRQQQQPQHEHQQVAQQQEQDQPAGHEASRAPEQQVLDDNDGAAMGLALLGEAAAGMLPHDSTAAGVGSVPNAMMYPAAGQAYGGAPRGTSRPRMATATGLLAAVSAAAALGGHTSHIYHGRGEGVTCQVSISFCLSALSAASAQASAQNH